MESHLTIEGPMVGGPAAADYAQGMPPNPSPLARSAQNGIGTKFNEDFDSSRPQSAMLDNDVISSSVRRSNSVMSQSQTLTPSRGGTLKKKNSLKRGNSLRRSSSRRSLAAGSVKSLSLGDKEKYEGSDLYSAFFTPVPTRGNPTEILANRFQDWRKVLKDLISYFREVQKTHEARSKQLLSLSNIVSNISGPPGFLREGGIGEATAVLAQYHKQALAESNKAKNIEEDIMVQLTGLRSDLSQKTKEIKNLSGDFKNSVDKETDNTRKAVRSLQEALGLVDTDPSATSGKGDPYIVKLGVERQIDRQIDEENYLHKAFLNLEHSGRELESIVVGEIQKAYNAYAGILKREADEAYDAVEKLRNGPVAMAKDREWDAFVLDNENFVDPRMPVRSPDQITYPGKDAPAAAEVRSGMLERKSKYLKSYTAGWYVLSPTHLHEFKSADRLNLQTPVMSLYLQEQKLGSHSNPESSSHKFMLKGRQTGGMHRGHGWVFRAESRETMLEWYHDIKNLTEKTGMERDAFVRKHARSVSGGSVTARSVSSDGGMEEDEADQVPYSASASQTEQPQILEQMPERPQPGGRFPSDLNVERNLHVSLSHSSRTSSNERNAVADAATLPSSGIPFNQSGEAYPGSEYASPATVEAEGSIPPRSVEDNGQSSPSNQSPFISSPIMQQQARATTIDEAAAAVAELTAATEAASHTTNQKSERIDTTGQVTVQTQLPERSFAYPTTSTAPFTSAEQHLQSLNSAPTNYAHYGSAKPHNPLPPVPGVDHSIPSAPAHYSSLPMQDPHNSGANTPTTTLTQLSDSPPQSPEPRPLPKPSFASQSSVQTISDLHVPGEYPRHPKQPQQ